METAELLRVADITDFYSYSAFFIKEKSEAEVGSTEEIIATKILKDYINIGKP